MRRILITGASGQIGRWLLHELAPLPGLQLILALRHPIPQRAWLQDWLAARGVRPAQPLLARPLDLDRPDTLDELVAQARPDLLIHLAARFAWGLDQASAQRANVQASLALLRALHDHDAAARFIHLSGFMLQHRAHLARLGIATDGQARDWAAVYRRAGGYEASKLQSHADMLAQARQRKQPLLVLHPATVAGHSVEGELPTHAALYQLCQQLLTGRLSALPGTPAHRLPLVAVDHVARFLARLALDETVRGGEFLLMDPDSPPLPELAAQLATTLGRRAPRRHLPIPLLRALLRLPGLADWSGSHPESLDFLVPQSVAFDDRSAQSLAQRWGLRHPPLAQVLQASALFVRQRAAREG